MIDGHLPAGSAAVRAHEQTARLQREREIAQDGAAAWVSGHEARYPAGEAKAASRKRIYGLATDVVEALDQALELQTELAAAITEHRNRY